MTDDKTKSTSRRSFVTAIAAGIAAATAAITTTVLPAAVDKTGKTEKKKRKIRYGMVIDVRKCIGCHACTVACKSEFDVPLGVNRSWVEYVEKGEYPNVGRSFLPRLCNHCSEPPCVPVCPTNATYKRGHPRDLYGVSRGGPGARAADNLCQPGLHGDARRRD